MNNERSEREAMVAKTIVMLEMQDAMNSRVDPDWLERSRAWHRAIWIECAELMDHYGGWKWWKDSPCDKAQSLLEIVDIWHFGLSMRITRERNHRASAEAIIAQWNVPIKTGGFLRDVEELAEHALAHKSFHVAAVPTLLAGLDCDFSDLHRSYVGKNVLNFFRQDHGYREGSYVKEWHGREDNEHLVDILGVTDPDLPDYRDRLYSALKAAYPN